MTKPLLIATIVLSLGAAVLGFLNRGVLMQTRDDLAGAQAQLDTRTKELEVAGKDVEAKKAEIATLTTEKDALTTKVNEANNELTKAKEEITTAQTKLTEAETNLTASTTKITELETANKELQDKVANAESGPAPAQQTTEWEARSKELEQINSKLQDENAALKANVAEFKTKEDARQKVMLRPGLQGTILAVNQAWNFVVLSLGDRQGVVPNAELLVQRGSQLLGKVRVTSVEPSTSIADILVRTVPRGFTVMPGDTVIYQASNRD